MFGSRSIFDYWFLYDSSAVAEYYVNHLTQKIIRPSPLAPLPKKERGTRKIQNFLLTPLLPLWEKGLGDEGLAYFSNSYYLVL
jgi:hypothetical protein